MLLTVNGLSVIIVPSKLISANESPGKAKIRLVYLQFSCNLKHIAFILYVIVIFWKKFQKQNPSCHTVTFKMCVFSLHYLPIFNACFPK